MTSILGVITYMVRCSPQTKTAQLPMLEEVNITMTTNCTDEGLFGIDDGYCTYINTTNQSKFKVEGRR